jgi:hypothetical protein
MNYIVAIPSYNRSDIISKKTLSMLKDGGVNKEKIFIFVANNEEYKKYLHALQTYTDLYNKIIVGKLGITHQRNFIKKYFKENQRIVSIDDDIEGLYKLTNSTLVKIQHVDAFFKEAFERLNKEGLYIWGIYPVRNPYFMQNTVTTGLKFIIGGLYGFINRKLTDLNPSSESEGKEDYEQSILYYKKDGGVLRYNNVTIKTKFLAKGGLGELDKRFEINKKSANYLEKTYPDLVSIFHRKNGMTEIKLRNVKSVLPIRTKTKTVKTVKTKKVKTKTIKRR